MEYPAHQQAAVSNNAGRFAGGLEIGKSTSTCMIKSAIRLRLETETSPNQIQCHESGSIVRSIPPKGIILVPCVT
jgi:hypothetical protein